MYKLYYAGSNSTTDDQKTILDWTQAASEGTARVQERQCS